MCSDVLRCLQMIADVLGFSLDVLRMFSVFHGVSRMSSECSDGSCGLGLPGGSLRPGESRGPGWSRGSDGCHGARGSCGSSGFGACCESD